MLGKLVVPGRPTNLNNSRASRCQTNLDNSRAKTYCARSKCGWGLFGHFLSSIISHFFGTLSERRPDID